MVEMYVDVTCYLNVESETLDYLVKLNPSFPLGVSSPLDPPSPTSPFSPFSPFNMVIPMNIIAWNIRGVAGMDFMLEIVP